jgi:DNA-directed RNA polymerase specialized sigma24 family protein
MSTEEAAEALGLSPGALRAVLHRGVVALRATRALTLLEED